MANADPSPASAFEGWLQQMKGIFSPLFFTRVSSSTSTSSTTSTATSTSTSTTTTSLRRGLPSLLDDPNLADGKPLLLVGNHQLYGFDGPMIVEEFLRERSRYVRPLVFPPLLAEVSPLAPFPYPLPGTKETFERFGAVPVSARSLYKSLSSGETSLLFPGGAREVFKRKGEDYQLFWPDEADVVRLAARCNATLLPFSGIGGDESFTIALDSDELLNAPAGVGDFFRERVTGIPSLVEDDLFVPPFLSSASPRRHYFLFGTPIPTSDLDPTDREAVDAVYKELRGQVSGGLKELVDEVRPSDPYSDLLKRGAWEALYGVQAPGPPGIP